MAAEHRRIGKGDSVSALATSISHHAILIAATPARVWPWIINTDRWKLGAQLALIEGRADEAGATFAAALPSAPDATLYHVVNAEIVPNVRRTLSLIALDGSLIGFAAWRLTPSASSTIVDYDVYTLIAEPTHDQRVQTENRFLQELEALKALSEEA
jgi:hypothetical protein